MEGNEKQKSPNIDGGYAWAILVGGIIMYTVIAGSVKAYGILYTEMLIYYAAGSGNTAWIGSLSFLLMFGMGPFSNWLCIKYSFRKVSVFGGVLVSVGYSLSYFVQRVELMYLTVGLLAGLGYGMSYPPCPTIISFYFDKHRSLANGIVASGSGLGAFLFPFLYQHLVAAYGLPGTLLIVGGLTLHICVAACFFVQPEMLYKQKLAKVKQSENGSAIQRDGQTLLDQETEVDPPYKSNNDKLVQNDSQNCNLCSWGPDFKFSLYKNPPFLLLAVSIFFCMCGYASNLILIPAHVQSLGMGKTKVVLSVSIMGGCEVVARTFFGWFADQDYLQRKHIYLGSLLICALFAFITPAFDSFAYMAVYAAVVGVFPGSFWSLIAVLTIDVVGMEDFTPAFGLVMLSLAFGAVISQPVIGWLEDATGNWHASFYLTGVFLFVAGVLILFEPLVIQYCVKQNLESRDEEMNGMPIKRANPHSVPAQDTSSLLDEENHVSFKSE